MAAEYIFSQTRVAAKASNRAKTSRNDRVKLHRATHCYTYLNQHPGWNFAAGQMAPPSRSKCHQHLWSYGMVCTTLTCGNWVDLKSYRHNNNVIGGESKLLLPLSRCWECLSQVWIYESNCAAPCRKTSHLEVNVLGHFVKDDFGMTFPPTKDHIGFSFQSCPLLGPFLNLN
jgi:hypothetical protein